MIRIILLTLSFSNILIAQKSIEIDWQMLRRGVAKTTPIGFANFVAIKLNETPLQQQRDCSTCPIQVTESSVFGISTFTFKLKKNDLFYKNALTPTRMTLIFAPSKIFRAGENIEYQYLIKPACDTITQIIFQEIVNNVHNQTEKATEKPVFLGDMFDKLKNNDLKPWLDAIDNQVQSKVVCPKIFNLLKFIKDYQQSGFKTRESELAPELKSYLDATVDGLKQYLKNYKTEFVEIDLECTGYADPDNVSNRIDYKPSGSDKIYYDKKECGLNTATQIRRIALKETNLKGLVEVTQAQGINNNCELSVVRAYVALKYMQRQLNQDFRHVKINYFYAAGGIAKAISKEKSRKIDVKMVFKGAKQK